MSGVNFTNFPANSTNPSLYEMFGQSGPSALLIAVVGFRWIIAAIGFLLNMLLFVVTIKNESLHGTCNLFIAFDALSTALYQTSNSVSLFLVITGANFIQLSICLYIMVFAIMTVTLSMCATFFIGFDRLLSVLFPTIMFGKQKSKLFMGSAVTICFAYSLYILWNCWTICMTMPNNPVICSITDCFPKEVGQMSFRNSIIIVCFSSLNYVLIWLALKWKSIKNPNKGKATQSYTQRIFKSLTVIMAMVLLGWMLNASARFTLPLMNLNSLQTFFVSGALGCITNFVMACNAPVLFVFSKEYRKAILEFFRGKAPSQATLAGYHNNNNTAAFNSIHRSHNLNRFYQQQLTNTNPVNGPRSAWN